MKSFKNSLWFLLLASLLGCGSPAERLIKEQIQITNDMADRMESGKLDPTYAKAFQARALEIMKKQQELKLSAEEQKQLEDKYRPEMEKATARLVSAMQKMTGKPFPQIPGMPAGMRPPMAPEASKPADKEKEREQSEGSKPDDSKPEDDKKPPSP
jgi:hypothetical protein